MEASEAKPVVFHYQEWSDFDTPPIDGFHGVGPSCSHLWLYFPKDNHITDWINWSGLPNDIAHLKKQKALWCYKTKPLSPETKE